MPVTGAEVGARSESSATASSTAAYLRMHQLNVGSEVAISR